MKEIIIDGITYEAYEKKIRPLNPSPGEFVVCTKPCPGFWIVYKVLFSCIKGKKIVLVGENSSGNLCVIDRTYHNFCKSHMIYSGEPGAHDSDISWWKNETGAEEPRP